MKRRVRLAIGLAPTEFQLERPWILVGMHGSLLILVDQGACCLKTANSELNQIGPSFSINRAPASDKHFGSQAIKLNQIYEFVRVYLISMCVHIHMPFFIINYYL